MLSDKIFYDIWGPGWEDTILLMDKQAVIDRILEHLDRSDLITKKNENEGPWMCKQREEPPYNLIHWQPQLANEMQMCLCGDSQLVVQWANGHTAVKTMQHRPHTRLVRATLANMWAE